MRILMIGLGDIARKAYLPVLAGTAGVELHVTTRDPARLAEIAAAYRLPHHASVAAALDRHAFDAALVHAASAAHPELVELLLRRGIPVLVDKPLATNGGEAARLVDLADRSGTLLMVAFNRRHAPVYVDLQAGASDMLIMQKHRCGQPGDIRTVIFDDFIHVVDTLLFLSRGPMHVDTIHTVVDDGRLQSVTLTLRGGRGTAIGIMHRNGGLDEEQVDAIGSGVTRSVRNMGETIERSRGIERRTRRGDWAAVGRQRGFEAMCADFLAAVRDRRPTASADILLTHRICEAIVGRAEAAG